MIFFYRGIDKKGKRVKGILEANSLEEAKSKLKSNSIIYSTLKERKKLFKDTFFSKEMPAKRLSSISRNLSIYLKSGVSSIVYAVKLEKQQHLDDKNLKSFFDSLESLLEEGKSFYVALDSQKIYKIPDFFKQSVKVAEESGTLSIVLKEMADFLKDQEAIKSKISGAMAYPLFIIVVSMFMVGFMLSFVVPKITAMFKSLGQDLPKITQYVISAGNFVGNNWHIIVFIIFFTVFLFTYLYKNMTKFKFLVDSFLLKFPIFGKIIVTAELAKFSYMVSVLLDSGITFVQAFKLSSNTIKNSVLSSIFFDASQELVKGNKLSTSLLKNAKKLDKSFIQAISLGEETSQMKEILQNLSELYSQENGDKINLMLSLMEPVLILFVGVIIGFLIVAMLLPIFSMNLVM